MAKGRRALVVDDIVAFRADALPILREVLGFGEGHVACTLSSIRLSAVGKTYLLATPWRSQFVEVWPGSVHLWSNPTEIMHRRMLELEAKILKAQAARRREKQRRNAKLRRKTANG